MSLKAGVHAAALDRDTRYAWLGTIVECQLEIARLTDRVQLFEDAKYPDEIARLEGERRTAIKKYESAETEAMRLNTRNWELKTQLERAEALLRRCDNVWFKNINQDIAAYFRESEDRGAPK